MHRSLYVCNFMPTTRSLVLPRALRVSHKRNFQHAKSQAFWSSGVEVVDEMFKRALRIQRVPIPAHSVPWGFIAAPTAWLTLPVVRALARTTSSVLCPHSRRLYSLHPHARATLHTHAHTNEHLHRDWLLCLASAHARLPPRPDAHLLHLSGLWNVFSGVTAMRGLSNVEHASPACFAGTSGMIIYG